jgi:hypothetical protein
MPTPENLKLRVQLIAKFDQLRSRLESGDEAAIEEAQNHISGLIVCDDMPTLALAMKCLAGLLLPLVARLEAGDETAVKEAHDHFAKLFVCKDLPTLAMTMKALAGVLESFQGQVDEEGLHW